METAVCQTYLVLPQIEATHCTLEGKLLVFAFLNLYKWLVGKKSLHLLDICILYIRFRLKNRREASAVLHPLAWVSSNCLRSWDHANSLLLLLFLEKLVYL